MTRPVVLLITAALGIGCGPAAEPPPAATASSQAYFDNAGRDDVLAGGVKMIPVNTPKGTCTAGRR
jgi:proline iminopeptidase